MPLYTYAPANVLRRLPCFDVHKPGEYELSDKDAATGTLSVRQGGDQIEYADQDPRIHPIFLEEMRKAGLQQKMDRFFPGAGR